MYTSQFMDFYLIVTLLVSTTRPPKVENPSTKGAKQAAPCTAPAARPGICRFY